MHVEPFPEIRAQDRNEENQREKERNPINFSVISVEWFSSEHVK
jgi:hypothetical protein